MCSQFAGRASQDAPGKSSSVEEQFRSLADQWLAGMGFSSNPEKLMAHPAFQSIVALGMPAVPFLLHELEARPSLLVWALPEITKADPVPNASRGNMAEMARAWLEWGRQGHLI